MAVCLATVLLLWKKGKTDIGVLLAANCLRAATEDPFKVCESTMYMIKTKNLNEMKCSGKNVNQQN